MVHGVKKQSFNKIISSKPADATRANALPPSVGAKKSGGFANRLLSLAQPRPVKKTSSQPSCEYFYIQNNNSGEFLDTVPEGVPAVCYFNTGTNPYTEYKVKLVSTGKPNGSKYIINKEGKYMTVEKVNPDSFFVTFGDKDELSLQEFIVTGTIGSTDARIQTPDNGVGIVENLYLTKNTEARFEVADNALSFPSASRNGC